MIYLLELSALLGSEYGLSEFDKRSSLLDNNGRVSRKFILEKKSMFQIKIPPGFLEV
jgi:hypothetical protein